MVKKIQYTFLIYLVLAGFTGLADKTPQTLIKTIVIDAGHGGQDPGCHGVEYKEKDISLSVALKLGKLLEENLKDVKIIYTRTSDVFVELEERAQTANRFKADLFVSIHCNAAGKKETVTDKRTGKTHTKMYKNKKGKLVPVESINPVPFGTETYVMGLKNEEGKMKVATRENSAIFYETDYEKKYGGFDPESEESYIIMSNYTSAYVIQSANLALKMQDEYSRKAGRIDKGVHRQSIWVLWRTSMPSILTEIGYLTNPLEEKFLASELGQDYLAKAMFRGIRKYKDELEGTKREYKDEFENQIPLENENIKAGNIPQQSNSEDEEKSVSSSEGNSTKEAEKKEVVKTEAKTENSIEKKVLQDTLKNSSLKIEVKDSYKTTTISPNIITKDTSQLSAKQIAAKFKQESKKENIIPEKNMEVKKDEIKFRVQFASSDLELDLSQPKYALLKETSFYKVGSFFKYTSGNFSDFKEAVHHQNYLRENGYKDCFVIALKNNEKMDLMKARRETGQ